MFSACSVGPSGHLCSYSINQVLFNIVIFRRSNVRYRQSYKQPYSILWLLEDLKTSFGQAGIITYTVFPVMGHLFKGGEHFSAGGLWFSVKNSQSLSPG